jgi:hypothetical protein
MNELDRIHETMEKIFDKIEVIQKDQVCCKKDIEYIKKEINGKMDKRFDEKIKNAIITEKYKGLVGLIGGIFGSIGFIVTLINFIVG